MTPTEFGQKLRENVAKKNHAEHAIAEYARTLIPVLTDAGRPASAKELERLIFEYDVHVQEEAELVSNNRDALLQFVMSRGDG